MSLKGQCDTHQHPSWNNSELPSPGWCFWAKAEKLTKTFLNVTRSCERFHTFSVRWWDCCVTASTVKERHNDDVYAGSSKHPDSMTVTAQFGLYVRRKLWYRSADAQVGIGDGFKRFSSRILWHVLHWCLFDLMIKHKSWRFYTVLTSFLS